MQILGPEHPENQPTSESGSRVVIQEIEQMQTSPLTSPLAEPALLEILASQMDLETPVVRGKNHNGPDDGGLKMHGAVPSRIR